MDSDLSPIEEQLRASRPTPDERFVDELEERLLPRPARRRRPIGRPLLAASATAAALALTVIGAGLLGGGPLAPGGDDGARAGDDCSFVTVRERVRTPVVVTGRDGRSEIRYRSKLETRRVKRCD